MGFSTGVPTPSQLSKHLFRKVLHSFLVTSLALLLHPQAANAQTGTFSATGSMTAVRILPTATLLPNGKVLLAGGGDTSNNALASAELYDPTTGTFSATGSMSTARVLQTATLLTNGKVLVAGGLDGSITAQASAEVYDPTTGIFTPACSMSTGRYLHTATLLSNGKVLIAAGCYAVDGGSCQQLASAELYDPGTGTFSLTGSTITSRDGHTATLFPNGQVLVTGGQDSSFTFAQTSAELYDPTTGTFSATGSMITARYSHTATLLTSGKVLVACGYNSGVLASAELYDPTTGTFSATGSTSTARVYQSTTLLPNGQVLVAGGSTASVVLASAELYDPTTGGFSATGSMTTARALAPATLLTNNEVLIAGGSGNSGILASAELYAPAIPTAPLSMGPQAMEGNLRLSPGATLEAGYDFTMPGNHPASTVTFVAAMVTFAWTCVSGPGNGNLVVSMPAQQSYTETQNSSAWYPSGQQNSPSVYQGSTSVPNVCSGGQVSFQAGGTFSAGVSSTDTADKVNVRWHYSGNGSAGGWSGTKSVVPQ
jgi:hypothetical protein